MDSKDKTEKKKSSKKRKKKSKLPKIDLSNWSVTVPAEKAEGKPVVVEPPEILNYATNQELRPYMYTDSIRGAIVFYAEPTNATTPNSKYSRSELREQMVPGDNNVNWTFAQGGVLKGKLAVDRVSRDSSGKHHRVIIMQIHGRLTDEQRDLIGQKDNNAPPVLKIYWDKGKIRVKTKKLKNIKQLPRKQQRRKPKPRRRRRRQRPRQRRRRQLRRRQQPRKPLRRKRRRSPNQALCSGVLTGRADS